MLSKIWIDLDTDNHPIIRIEYKPSDDVRDKMVKRFMEGFGGESYIATFFFNNSPVEQINHIATIRPLPADQFRYHFDEIRKHVPADNQVTS